MKKILNTKVLNMSGESVSLSDYKDKYVVLYIYPRDNTPGCTKEACDFRDNYSKIKKLGVEIIGLSGDSVKSHEKFTDKFDLNFTLWSDPDRKLIKALNAEKEKSMFGKTYMGIVRSTFIFSPKGEIIKSWDKVKVAGHVDEVYEFLVGEIKS